MIDSIRRDTGHSVRVICAVLDVPRSSYYHAAAPTPTQRSDQEIGEVIEEIFKSHQGRYRHRRISAELTAKGLTCAPSRVRRIMRKKGPQSPSAKEFHARNQRWPDRLPISEPPP